MWVDYREYPKPQGIIQHRLMNLLEACGAFEDKTTDRLKKELEHRLQWARRMLANFPHARDVKHNGYAWRVAELAGAIRSAYLALTEGTPGYAIFPIREAEELIGQISQILSLKYSKDPTPDNNEVSDMHAPFGWTVVCKGGGHPDPTKDKIVVYKRDTPADAEHFAADLAPFTFPTKRLAEMAGKAGNYAYKHKEAPSRSRGGMIHTHQIKPYATCWACYHEKPHQCKTVECCEPEEKERG